MFDASLRPYIRTTCGKRQNYEEWIRERKEQKDRASKVRGIKIRESLQLEAISNTRFFYLELDHRVIESTIRHM